MGPTWYQLDGIPISFEVGLSRKSRVQKALDSSSTLGIWRLQLEWRLQWDQIRGFVVSFMIMVEKACVASREQFQTKTGGSGIQCGGLLELLSSTWSNDSGRARLFKQVSFGA